MQRKEGFTLIEIIAVVAILGVLSFIIVLSVSSITEQMRQSYYDKQANLIILAGKDFFSSNRSKLPKKTNDYETVSVATLIKEKYIDPVKDYKGKSCEDEQQFVTVTKQNNGKYTYYFAWNCQNEEKGGDHYHDDVGPMAPSITVNSQDDYMVTITAKKDQGNPTTGIRNTTYQINEGKEVNYYHPFQVKDVLGKITITAKSYDYAGNASEESSVTFYTYSHLCTVIQDDSCSQDKLYNKNCKGNLSTNGQNCIYDYKANQRYECRGGDPLPEGTNCSRGATTESYTETLTESLSGWSKYNCVDGKVQGLHGSNYNSNVQCSEGYSNKTFGGCSPSHGDDCTSGGTATCSATCSKNVTHIYYVCPSSLPSVTLNGTTCNYKADLNYYCEAGSSQNGSRCTKKTNACQDGEAALFQKCYSIKKR